jgi:hypothetical protein
MEPSSVHTRSTCVPRKRRDTAPAACESWCLPSHCGQWCRCAACTSCLEETKALPLCRLQPRPLQGRWYRKPAAGWHHKEPCIDQHRGTPAHFVPDNCSVARHSVRRLRGRIMLIGDSLIQFQFDALLAWLRRAGRTMQCTAIHRPETSLAQTSRTARRGGRLRDRLPELLYVNRYQGAEMDCEARGAPALTLMVRRLNLLPPSEAALARVLDPLFAPVGRDGIVVLNVGLWYGPLARLGGLHESAHHGAMSPQVRPSREVRGSERCRSQCRGRARRPRRRGEHLASSRAQPPRRTSGGGDSSSQRDSSSRGARHGARHGARLTLHRCALTRRACMSPAPLATCPLA